MQNLFTFEYLFTYNHIFICLHIAYKHIHLTPGTSYSVRVAGHVLSAHNC